MMPDFKMMISDNPQPASMDGAIFRAMSLQSQPCIGHKDTDLGNAARFVLPPVDYSGGPARLRMFKSGLRRLGQSDEVVCFYRKNEIAVPGSPEFQQSPAVRTEWRKVEIFNYWKARFIEAAMVNGDVAEVISDLESVVWADDEGLAFDNEADAFGMSVEFNVAYFDYGHKISFSDGDGSPSSEPAPGEASSLARKGDVPGGAA